MIVVGTRLDYIGQIVLVLQLTATAPQAYVAFGLEGAGFTSQLATSALLELALCLLSARTAKVRDKLGQSLTRHSVGLAPRSIAHQLSRAENPDLLTPRCVVIAIYAAYASPGEMIGILSGAAL